MVIFLEINARIMELSQVEIDCAAFRWAPQANARMGDNTMGPKAQFLVKQGDSLARPITYSADNCPKW